MAAGGLEWLTQGLREEAWGHLPLSNLSSKGQATTIRDYKSVCSYGWYDGEDPILVIPSSPREMVHWNGGKLEPDKGIMMYYEDHFRMPHASMESMFQALKVAGDLNLIKEPINFQDYDLITDAVNLQKLFAFCKGESDGLFRIDFERMGNTIIATRVEGADTILIDFDTFDLSLKKACTRMPFKAESHVSFYQIVEYKYGNVKLLVRFDADCADYTKIGGLPEDPANPGQLPTVDKDKAVKIEGTGLSYIHAGQIKPYSLVSAQTFPHGKGFPFHTWAQLFFTGIDTLLLGWWKGAGDFPKPAAYGLSDINKLMKPLPLTALSKVQDALTKICAFIKQCHLNARVTVLWRGEEKLEIFERTAEMPVGVTEEMRKYLSAQVDPELVRLAAIHDEDEDIEAEVLAEQRAQEGFKDYN